MAVPIETTHKLMEALRELKRSDLLPYYNADVLSCAIADINRLAHTTEETVNRVQSKMEASGGEEDDGGEDPFDDATAFEVHSNYTRIQRNKRCIMAYLRRRMTMQEALVHRKQLHGEMLERLGAAEARFARDYAALIAAYSAREGVDIGGVDVQHPPKDLYIEVLVKQDCEIVTTNSEGSELTAPPQPNATLKLQANTFHYLPRHDVQHLLRSGHVIHRPVN